MGVGYFATCMLPLPHPHPGPPLEGEGMFCCLPLYGREYVYTAANTISAPFSPIAIDGILVFDDGMVGQIDESITRRF